MRKEIVFYQLSLAGKAFLAPFYFGKKKVSFKPTFVSLEVEDGCNLRCLHCDIWKKRKKLKRMRLSEMKKVVRELKKWLGVFQLNLTGGEPFLNKETIPLIKYASSLGILVHTNSNGFLIDGTLAKRIVASGLNSISISLDNLDPKVHNRLRGNSQVFKRAVRALSSLSKFRKPSRPFLSVTTIIMKPTLSGLEKLAFWAKEEGIDAIYFQSLWQNFGAEYDQDWFKKSPLWPKDYKKAKKVLDCLLKLKKNGYPIGNSFEDFERYKSYYRDPITFGGEKKCFIGVNNFAIDIAGDVRLCFNFPSIGNILKEKPEEIWNGREAQKQRLKIAGCQRGCKVLLCNRIMSRKEALVLLVNKARRFLR
ncbi:radical SAM protein [Candidatus Microgenomates bacterium]|nr:radical SAM protein [Candidatus Microgenomates bacterium]